MGDWLGPRPHLPCVFRLLSCSIRQVGNPTLHSQSGERGGPRVDRCLSTTHVCPPAHPPTHPSLCPLPCVAGGRDGPGRRVVAGQLGRQLGIHQVPLPPAPAVRGACACACSCLGGWAQDLRVPGSVPGSVPGRRPVPAVPRCVRVARRAGVGGRACGRAPVVRGACVCALGTAGGMDGRYELGETGGEGESTGSEGRR